MGCKGDAGVRVAAQRLTGFTAHVAPGRLEIRFGDEHELEELVESLERIA